MTSLLSFSWRRAQEANHQHHRNNINPNINVNRSTEIDPWGLGIATSTSSADSLVLPHNHSSSEDTQLSTMERVRTVQVPTTPEGLRPRKMIHKLRQEILGYSHPQGVASENSFRYHDASPTINLESCSASKPLSMSHHGLTMSCPPTSFTCEPPELPPVLQCHRESPQTTLHSSLYMSGNYEYYDQVEIDHEDEFDDIVSMMASPTISRGSRRELPQQVAESPDLKPGKVKTAVGAVLAAMTEINDGGNDKYQANNEGSQHSILPSREWMDLNDKDFVVEDEVDAFGKTHNHDDDNESSLHASPSSNAWKPGKFTSWKERQEQFQQDTSFTRNILSRDHNASWQQGNGKDQEPYDFDPILSEEEEVTSLKDSIDAPRVLDLIHDHGGLNVSAISSSQHPRDLMSMHSLADTIEDDEEEEDYNQVNQYQPLIDDMMQPEEEHQDDALLLLKAENQRRIKEQLILSTLERLCDDFDLLKEVSLAMQRNRSQCPSPRNNLLLGMNESERTRIIQEMESLLTKWSVDSRLENHSQETERLALRFCFMVLQTPMNSPKPNSNDIYAPSHRWKPLPGLRSAIGLEEDPVSPPTVRGGDSSLFSLPSDSANANDDTPHTSNVSIATTITTVLSPEKNWSSRRSPNTGLRQTFESMTRLLGRLEAACLLLLTVNEKIKTSDEIKQIYLEFLQLPFFDLKTILHFFELHYEYPPLSCTARTVSEDYEEKKEDSNRSHSRTSNSLILPPAMKRVSSKDPDDVLVAQTATRTQDILRIQVVENSRGAAGQEVECDLWTPTTDDMNSYVPLDDDEGPSNFASVENSESSDEEERGPIEDLRRTVGSFDDLRRTVDLESVQEERDGALSEDGIDEDQYETEITHAPLRTNGVRRHHVGNATSRWKSRGFWKGRILGSRPRRFSSAE